MDVELVLLGKGVAFHHSIRPATDSQPSIFTAMQGSCIHRVYDVKLADGTFDFRNCGAPAIPTGRHGWLCAEHEKLVRRFRRAHLPQQLRIENDEIDCADIVKLDAGAKGLRWFRRDKPYRFASPQDVARPFDDSVYQYAEDLPSWSEQIAQMEGR